jgi:glycosyltransferase involved in cell wall biosynthesis
MRTRHPSRVYLLGDERPGYRQHLLEHLPAPRRGDVHFIPLVTPTELPLKLTEFDIGLALEPPWPRNRDVTISNKIFQYMNAGLALVTTDTAGQSEVMRAAPESGLLIQAHETTENARRLDALIGDRYRLRSCQNAARTAAASEFCWEKDSRTLLQAVERALAPEALPAP